MEDGRDEVLRIYYNRTVESMNTVGKTLNFSYALTSYTSLF